MVVSLNRSLSFETATEILLSNYPLYLQSVLLDFSLTVKTAPHECVIRTSQPGKS